MKAHLMFRSESGKRGILAVVAAISLAGAGEARGAGDFIRGDSNGDSELDISDASFTLDYLFTGGRTPECLAAADSNDDEAIDISDPIAALEFLFIGAGPLPPPGPSAGPDPTPGIGCARLPPPGNRAPTITLLSPAPGAVLDAASLEVRGRVSDDGRVLSVRVEDADATPPSPPPGSYAFAGGAPLRPGPNLIRVKAADEYGRASSRDLAVGLQPLLLSGAPADGMALDLSAAGFDEVEALLQPLLAGVAPLLDGAVRGVQLFQGDILGVDIQVTGERAEIQGAIGLDLQPTDDLGGRLALVASFERVILFADGRSDYGFLGTDSWDAVWEGGNLAIRTTISLAPGPGGASMVIASDGFTAEIGSSDLAVSGFLDPFGIFDGLVNFLADVFRDQIEAQVKAAVEDVAEAQIVPILEDAFSGLDLDLDLGTVQLDTSVRDALESGRGLSILFSGAWLGLERDPAFPRYPGSRAAFAPYPAFPVSASTSHEVDATISLSADTLNQALAELTASGFLSVRMGVPDGGLPVTFEVGSLAAILEPALATLPGVAHTNPIGIRVAAERPVEVVLGEGTLGRPLVGEGAFWTFRRSSTEPPSTWKDVVFDDSAWERGPSGFGYSADPSELRSVRTALPAMTPGEYSSLHARLAFDIPSPGSLGPLHLRVTYDDAFVAYLNGREVARANVTGSPPAFGTASDAAVEPTTEEFDLAPYRSFLRQGRNVLAVQAHNAAATSSDFIITAGIIERTPLPAGTVSAIPVILELEDLDVAFEADAAEDGVGADDADGIADEVVLFGFRLGLRLQARLSLRRGEDGRTEAAIEMDAADGPDPDIFPDAVVGGAAGLGIRAGREAIDIDDAQLVDFARLVLGVFAPSLGETLAGFAFPSFPLPELAFDLNGDGSADVRLDIARATLALAETSGGGDADWICILADLVPR